jgi:hypothetical protein
MQRSIHLSRFAALPDRQSYGGGRTLSAHFR